ncbi:MAG: ABC transporter substrate-binding protein [Lachnospiraceae bacterium]|nr:ABC transporter substrate-binding protein [Lachnospiraceae bacterium]
MKKKVITALLCATMTIGMMAGCGSGKGSDQGGKAKYKVGICQLVQHPALDAATEGFKEAMEKELGKDNVSFDEQNAAGDSATCATIANSFVSQKVDLIMANATASVSASASATADIPIVGTSVTDYGTALGIKKWTGKSGTNVTGTSDLAPLDQQAQMLNELFPDAKTVGIIYCSAEANSKYQVDTITPYLEKMGYTVKSFTFSDSNDVASVTKTACDSSDVLYIPTDNVAANCAENINNVAVQAKTPIVAGEEGICKGCGVATLSISYKDLGYKTGEMAAKILKEGTKPGEMEIETADTVTKEYNKALCDKLGVKVPEDYKEIKAD